MFNLPENFYMEEYRCEYLITKEKKALWSVLLKLSMEVKRICEKYNIRYFLYAGSLLGAVRHNGFIPWDDDMDFVFFREDMEKFLKVSEKELHPPFFLQTPENSGDIFSFCKYKLRMDGTTGIQSTKDLFKTAHNGIAIDLLVYDYSSDIEKKVNTQRKKIDNLFGIMLLKKYGIHDKALNITLRWNRLKIITALIISKFVNEKNMIKKIKKNSCLYNNEPGDKLKCNCEINGRFRFVETKDFSETVNWSFEGICFPVPIGYDNVLRKYYGEDYMEFPPKKLRKGHHYAVFSVSENYTEYLSRFHNIFKNTKGKKIIIFGAGEMLNHYLINCKKKYHPNYITDNNSLKWETSISGIPVISPCELLNIPNQERHVIICSIYYKEISAQLESMGITEYYIYVQDLNWL